MLLVNVLGAALGPWYLSLTSHSSPLIYTAFYKLAHEVTCVPLLRWVMLLQVSPYGGRVLTYDLSYLRPVALSNIPRATVVQSDGVWHQEPKKSLRASKFRHIS